MAMSWDLGPLRTHIAELPEELALLLETGEASKYLSIISHTLLDKRYTDIILTTCEPVLADLCARFQSTKYPQRVLEAYGRIVPFAPYLAEYAERHISTHRDRLWPESDDPEDMVNNLLSIYRLLVFDQHTFAKHLRLSDIQRLLEHDHGAVRYVALRIVCRLLHAADAAMLKMYAKYLPQDDATGLWEDKEIHYKYLTLWEDQRQNTVKERLKAARRDRKERRMTAIVEFDVESFHPSTVCISGVLLPRLERHGVFPSNSPAFILTDTINDNLKFFAQQLKSSRPVLVTGLAGSGKTAMIRHVASQLEALDTMVTLHLNEQSDAKTLIGMYTTGETPGSFSWQAGVLTKAVLEGRWIFIEDIDRAPNEILSTLLPLIERRELMIPGRNETIKAARGFKIIATTRTSVNQQGHQIQPLTSMLGARHWRRAHVRTSPTTELREIIIGLHPALREHVPILVAVYEQLLTLRRDALLESRSKTGVMRIVSQRDLLKWAGRVAVIVGRRSSKFAEDDDQVFLDAVDCFAGSLSAGSAFDSLTSCIAQHLQIDPQRKEHILYNRTVPYTLDYKDMSLGRHHFARQSRRSPTDRSRQTFSANAHTLRLLERVGTAVAQKEPLLLVGETGTGKTTSIQYLANQLGKKLAPFNLSQQSESGDLLGGFKPVNIRTLMVPLKDEFDELFNHSFPPRVILRNQSFLDLLAKCMAKAQWLRVCKCWNTAMGMVEESRLSAMTNGSSSPSRRGNTPHKKRRVELGMSKELLARWENFSLHFKNIERRLLAGSESSFAFSFVEGNIVKAVRNGDWVLLDEINLATPDTLEALADLFDASPSLMLSEAGSTQRIEAHPEFRVFAAMNPATDVGKKDLPLGIRSRFTELYVESPDKNLQSLRSIVQAYLGSNEAAACADVSNLHRTIQDMAEQNLLADGAGQKPHFSLRTLTRALSYAKDVLPQCSLRRALYEAFQMSYLTLLNNESEALLTPLIRKHLFGGQAKLVKEAKQPMRKPRDENVVQHIQEGRYFLKAGSQPIEEQPHYIITDFIGRNLDNLVRATSTRRFPILLQGPTSSGKTSMVEYLAKRSGNKFVRINNHEHTDLQEYLGAYISGADGKLQFQEGLLVNALREGHWIVLDELNLAPTDVLEALNRLLDENRELLIPEIQETVRPHENFMLFATQNPAGLYGGRKVLSRAFRNRFLELHFDDIPIDELHVILHRRTRIPSSWCQRIVSVYKELTVLRQENRVFESKSFATLRDLFRWALRPADTIDQLASNGFMLLAERVRKMEERQAVKKIIEKVLSQMGPKVTIDESSIYGRTSTELSPSQAESLASSGTVWTSAMRRLYVLTLNAIRNNEPVLLVGETGSGKTTVCQMLAQAMGKELHIVNAHQNTETGDLIGAQRPARNRAAVEQTLRTELSYIEDDDLQTALHESDLDTALQVYDTLRAAASKDIALASNRATIDEARIRLKTLFEWVDGSLVHAMKSGQLFLIDEISLADDSVLERLNSVLEPQRSLLLAEKGSLDSFVTAADGFQFFATMNPGGDYGKKELSPALRNRFTEIWVPSLSDVEDILQIARAKLMHPSVADAVVSFAGWFHDRYNRTASHSISIRDMLAWVEFINRFPDDLPIGLVHGAAMVYIDSLGANPAALLAINSADVARERVECVVELGRLLALDALAVYNTPVVFEVTKSAITIGPFRVSKAGASSGDAAFTFAAPTTRSNAMRIVRALQLIKPVLIEGNPGVGKTTLVTALAQAVGTSLTRINLSEQTDLMDLFGSDIPVEGAEAGTFAWRDAPFLRAMKAGEWVLLDEMNLASQSVLEGLNACLDHRGEVYISELDQTFQRHPDFRLFAAQNPHHQGGGRKGLPASFVNRFTVVYADVFQHEDLVTICQASFPRELFQQIPELVDFITKLDAETIEGRLGTLGGPWEFNLRDTLRWLSLIANERGLLKAGTAFDFLPLIISQRFRTQKDRSLIVALFQSVFQDTPPAHSLFHSLSEAFFQVGMGLLPRDVLMSPTTNGVHLHHDFRPNLGILESMMISVQKSWPVILVGPSGIGKTALIEKLATMVGASVVTFPLNADIDAMDLVGGYEQSDPQRQVRQFVLQTRAFALRQLIRLLAEQPTNRAACDWFQMLFGLLNESASHNELAQTRAYLEQAVSSGFTEGRACLEQLSSLSSESSTIGRAQFEWVDGALVQALQRGDWLVLDNANLCSPAVLDRLNSLLEPDGILIINEHTDSAGQAKVIKPHPSFRIFLTMDPKYGELSRALRNRCIELCVLPEEIHSSNTPALTLPFESQIYRLSNAGIPASSDSLVAHSPLVAGAAADHFTRKDSVSLPSFVDQIRKGLFTTGGDELVTSVDRIRDLGHLEQDTIFFEINKRCSDNWHLTSLQTFHPMNNDCLIRSSELPLQHFEWYAAVFEARVDLAKMHAALSDISQVRGPQRGLTRLQRSALAKQIPNAARDTTYHVYPFCVALYSALSAWANEAGKDGSSNVCFPAKQYLNRARRFLWDLFASTNSKSFDEASYQTYLELGRSLINGMHAPTEMLTMLKARLKTASEQLGASDQLVNAKIITALWTELRPETTSTFEQLQTVLALEELADRFDASAWTFEVSNDQLLGVRESFGKALQISARSAKDSSLVQTLTDAVSNISYDAQTVGRRPHFRDQFEAICQTFDLAVLSTSGHADHGSRRPPSAAVVTLFAQRPTKVVVQLGSEDRRSPSDLLRSLGSYLGMHDHDKQSLALSSPLASSLTTALQTSDRVSLHNLDLLQREIDILRIGVTRNADMLQFDQVAALQGVLKVLLIDILKIVGSSNDSPPFSQLLMLLIKSLETGDLSIATDMVSSAASHESEHVMKAAVNFLKPCAASLMPSQHTSLSAEQSELKNAANAWIGFALASVELYVPRQVFDPALKPLIQRDMFRRSKEDLEARLSALKHFERHFTGQTSNMRIRVLESDIAELGSEPQVSEIARPPDSQMVQLHGELQALMRTLSTLMHADYEHLSDISNDSVLRANVAQLKQRLDVGFRAYDDITTPLVGLLHCLEIGFTLAGLAHQQLDQSLVAASHIHALTPLLGANPDDWSTGATTEHALSQPLQVQMHALSSFGSLRSLISEIPRTSWDSTHHIFDSLYQQWKLELQSKQQENATNSSLYRYRGGDDLEDERDDDEYRTMFPDYDNDDSSNHQTAPREMNSMASDIADLLQAIVIPASGLVSPLSSLMDRTGTVLASVQSASRTSGNLQKLETMPLLITMLGQKSDDLQIPSVLGQSYNIYTDMNISEAQKLILLVERVQVKFRSIQAVWPEHATLGEVLRTCDELLAFKYTEPVVKFLSKLEKLHDYVHQWQKVTSKEYSAATIYDNITDMIVSWRQLELSTWSRLLDMETLKCKDDAKSWWFIAYENIVAVPLSTGVNDTEMRAHVVELLKTLESFFLSTGLGQYAERLRMLTCFQQYVKIRSASVPTLHFVSDALSNFISYMSRFEQTISDAIAKGRVKLEKDMKNVIQMASWKDRTIEVLRQSAKSSHRKLFKIIRKFRALLGQPTEAIIRGGMPEIAGQMVPSNQISSLRRVEGKLYADARAICEATVPGWTDAPARFMNTSATLSVMRSLGQGPGGVLDGASEVSTWLTDVEETITQLRKLTPLVLTEENKTTVQHLKTRKRGLFADVLKELRIMGFKSNLSSDALAQQDSQQLVLATMSVFSESGSSMLADAESQLQQILQVMPQVREAAREHSGDLTSAEIARSIALVESMLQTIIEQRGVISSSQANLLSLDKSFAMVDALSRSSSLSPRTPKSKERYGIEAALSCLPALLDASADIVATQCRLGDLDGELATNDLRHHASMISNFHSQLRAQMQLPVSLTSGALNEIEEGTREALQTLRTTLHEIATAHPYFKYMTTQLLLWTDVEDVANAVLLERHVYLAQYSASVYSFVDLLLGSLEDARKALDGLPSSSESPQWLLQEGAALASALRGLRLSQTTAQLTELLDQLHLVDQGSDGLHVAAALLTVFKPIIDQYRAVADHTLDRLAALHQSTCTMSSRLAAAFARLAREGFCTPAEKSSGKDNTDDKVEGGTGLGDGEGGEDISKDVGDDEDLSELAQEPNQKKDEGEDIEDEKDAVDMADQDLEGEMGDVEEQEGGDDGQDKEGDEEEQDMEEEAGDVDDLGPSTVDEKMWDDGGKEDANKNQEADKAEGTKDQDDLAAAEGEQREKKEDGGEEAGDEGPEEETGANEDEKVGREEAEKADPHTQEQDNLDLPDDIDMDGQKEDGEDDDILGDLEGEDIMDEVQEVEADQQQEPEAVEGEAEDLGSPDISEQGEETEDVAVQDVDEEQGEKTEEAGEDAEEELPGEDENVLQDNRQDDSTAAEDVAPSEAQGTGLSDQQMQDQERQQDAGTAEQPQGAEGVAQEEQQLAGAQGQRGKAQEDKTANGQDEDDQPPDNSLPYKKLGDALKKWYRQHQQIADAQQQNSEEQQNKDTDMADVDFEHLPDEAAEADAQALGAASEDQATAIDEESGLATNDKETHEHFPPEDQPQEAEDKKLHTDVEMQDVDRIEADDTQQKEAQPNAFVGDYREPPPEQPESALSPVEQDAEDTEDVDDVDTQLSTTHLDRSSPSTELTSDHAREIWSHHESRTSTLSLVLTEHLRLILSPTQATKLRGDYRTGKRLNIKRIIPYIASSYKRDKIWMRRSVPSKRNYQIMLAVDDSRSMAESGAGDLAFDTLALVGRSLALLEAGEIAVVGFGEDVNIAHGFEVPFTSEAGAEVVRQIRFSQNQTDVKMLLEKGLGMFEEARLRKTGRAEELWQLMIIVSDGVCKDHEGIRRLVRQAAEMRVMIVFVVVDATATTTASASTSTAAGVSGTATRQDQAGSAPPSGSATPATKPSSILDLQTAKFGKDDKGNMTVETVKYIETFPFRYYLIVRDVAELPGVLASALRQWFAEVVDSGA